MKKNLSIILPTFNEKDNIKLLILRLLQYRKYNLEIIVVDDNSPDGTSGVVRSLIKKYPEIELIVRNNKRGLTSALKDGLLKAKGNIVCWLDCDLSMPPEEIASFLKLIDRYDLVVGSRFIKGGKDARKEKLAVFFGRLINVMARFFLGRDFYDYTSGFILVKKKIFKKIKLKGNYGEYFIGLIAQAKRLGYSIREVPYVFTSRIKGQSKTSKNLTGFIFKGRKYLYTILREWILNVTTVGSEKYFLFFLILFSAFLRLYRLYDLAYFSAAEDHLSFLIRQIATGRHFPLIGISGADTGIYMGPLFLYLVAPFYALFRLNPLGGYFFSALLGVFTTVGLYYAGKLWFNRKIGVIAAILYCFSHLVVIQDQHFWNVSTIPFTTVLVLYSLGKIIKKNHSKDYLVLFISLTIAFQSHFTGLFLLLLSIFVFWQEKIPVKTSKILLTFLLFCGLTFGPMLSFDLRHNFFNVRALINYFRGSAIKPFSYDQSIKQTINLYQNTLSRYILDLGTNITEELSDCQALSLVSYRPPLIVKFFLLLAFLKWLTDWWEKKDLGYLIIILPFALCFFVFSLYRSWLHEHYLIFLSPFLFLIIASFIDFLNKKINFSGTVVLIIFLFLNSTSQIKSLNPYSIKLKIRVVDYIIKQADKKPFAHYSLGPCHQWGWRYLFTYKGTEPVESFMDPSFSWMYDKEWKTGKPEKIFITALPGPVATNEYQTKLLNYYYKAKDRKQLGQIIVLQLENEKIN